MSGRYTVPFENAVYIKAQETPSDYSLYDPIPLFRKEFNITETIESAGICVHSPGFACFYINGCPITEDIFISPLSNYEKLIWYNTYDVTALLQKGRNTIGVMAGNGFFNESFDTAWDYHTAPWRDAPQFLLCLKVNGKPVLVSDESWKASRGHSPIIYSHLRSGEYYDARKADDSWLFSGYDDADWQGVFSRPVPGNVSVRPVACQPVREAEAISPVSVRKTGAGYLVDFGVTISGYMEITLQEPRDSEILFRYTEDVDENLYPKYNGMDDKHFYPESPFHLNKLIASGGVDTFKPKFCYHGFRYVQIEGLTKAPDPALICAYFTHQDIARKADFRSGNPVLNYIYDAGIRSTRSNLFWSLTDCPTREKLGWTNDASASMEQLLINFDIRPLLEKWFEDIKVDMRENGELPGVIPSNGWGDNWGPVCDNLLFELPYRTYLYTGDSSMLTGAIPYFERYVDFLWEKKLADHEFILGDWLGHDSSPLTPKKFVRDFHLIRFLRVTLLAHKLAGSRSQAAEDRLKVLTEEFLNRYLDENGASVVTSQCALAMLLQGDLVRDRQVIAEQLIDTVERDGFRLTCGMVGIQYLWDALTACGRPDYAYRMITESEPGYNTWYKAGATTLWECWDGRDRGSHNHHMFSNVLGWFFKSLLGICPEEESPAFARIELKPAFIRELGFVKGCVDTVRGRISAEWSYADGAFRYRVALPEGVNASFGETPLHPGINLFTVQDVPR